MTDVAERVEALQKETYEKLKELSELRRQLPPEPVEDVALQTIDGEVKLSELFGDKSDLIVVHNMGSG